MDCPKACSLAKSGPPFRRGSGICSVEAEIDRKVWESNESEGVELDSYEMLLYKGLMYSRDDSTPCTFKINLFKAPQNTKKASFLVEIQRRYGCIVAFRRFYQQILQALTTEGLAIPFSSSSTPSSTTAATNIPPATTTTSLSPIGVVPSPSQVSLDRGTLDTLFRSMGNPSKLNTVNLENLRETVRVLATVSRTSQNKAVLIGTDSDRTNLVEMLLAVLKLQDLEVRRCGATLLNNIASLEAVRGDLITKLSACMFELLDKSDDPTADSVVAGFMAGSLMEKEIQRQVAQTLATLTQTHARELTRQSSYPHYLETLNKCKASSDDLFRESVLLTLEHDQWKKLCSCTCT